MKKILSSLTKGTNIKINSTKECIYCGEDFIITDLELDILNKNQFKTPKHCYLCNFKILNSLLNDKQLYHRKDSFDNKNIISTFSADFKGKVMEAKNYKKFISDDGGLQYAKNIGEDIFNDFNTLFDNFPKASRLIYPSLENAEYSSHIGRSKDIYLGFCVFMECEKIYYSFRVNSGCKYIFNSYNIVESSNIYDSSNVIRSYGINFSDSITNSSSLLHCNNIDNSQDCIFSCNLVNAKYRIYNNQYSKDEYLKMREIIYKKMQNSNSYNELITQYLNFKDNNLIIQTTEVNRNESVTGDSTYDSKNCINSFIVNGVENGVNIHVTGNNKNDFMKNIINSIESGTNCENCIGSCSFGSNTSNIFHSFGVAENSNNIYYSYDIETSEECMFCIGLKSKKYCILNKQYTKEQYFMIKERIIKHLVSLGQWGDTIGLEFKNFPYNDTLAYDFFKIKKIIHFDGREEIINNNSKGTVKIFSNNFISDAELDLGGKEKTSSSKSSSGIKNRKAYQLKTYLMIILMNLGQMQNRVLNSL